MRKQPRGELFTASFSRLEKLPAYVVSVLDDFGSHDGLRSAIIPSAGFLIWKS